MSRTFRELAFELALEGKTETQAREMMKARMAAPAQIDDAINYAYHGDGTIRSKRVVANKKVRARKAASVLIQFYDKEDFETSTCDLIADLLHLAARRRTGFDFERALERGREHYEAELIDGEG